MPGIAELIDGAMQQAAQRSRQGVESWRAAVIGGA